MGRMRTLIMRVKHAGRGVALGMCGARRGDEEL